MPRAARSKNRKQEILEALVRMLEREGCSRITTSALAHEVGVSEAALYRHYPSKTRMFEGLLDYVEEVFFSRISAIREQKAPVGQSCAQVLELMLTFAEKNPGISRLLCADALSGEDPRLNQRVRQLFDRVETELRQILKYGEIEQGVRTTLPAGSAAKFMLSLVDGRLAQFLRSGFEVSPTNQLPQQWQIVESGLLLVPAS